MAEELGRDELWIEQELSEFRTLAESYLLPED